MTPPALSFPDHFETERLLIRAHRAGDGPCLFEGICDSLAQLRAWPASLPWAVYEPSLEASEQFCCESQADFAARRTLPMLLFLKSSGGYIGSCSLHDIDWALPKCEIGYWCRTGFGGQGLITEAVQAITAFALDTLGMHRIVSLPDVENGPSRRVVERAGYRLEGVMRHDRKTFTGQLRDTCLYAITP